MHGSYRCWWISDTKTFDAIVLLFSASLKAVKHCYVWWIYAGYTYFVFAYEKWITCPLLLLDMFWKLACFVYYL